ncbi:MAG: SLOG family protein [Pseudomonas sp.]
MRVLICAGRHYADSRQCRRVLDAFQRLHPVQVLIHGGNQYLGADIVRYPPNWQRHGKLAERLRNHFMLHDSRPDVVIALPGGEDTEELVAQARGKGLQTLSVADWG